VAPAVSHAAWLQAMLDVEAALGPEWARGLLEHLEVDADATRAGAGKAPDLGASSRLIDRPLDAHRS